MWYVLVLISPYSRLKAEKEEALKAKEIELAKKKAELEAKEARKRIPPQGGCLLRICLANDFVLILFFLAFSFIFFSCHDCVV